MTSRALLPLLAGSLVALVACGDDKKRSGSESDDRAGETKAEEDPAEPTLESVAALIEAARAEGFRTWPTSELGGIRVSLEVPPGERRNIYSVRVSFEFETDPTDATVKSGSVICSPKCQIIRHKVDAITHPWPKCSLADAAKAARKAGLRAKQPLVLYGAWGDGARWTFKEDADTPVKLLFHGDTCAPIGADSTAQPDKTITQPAPIPAGSVAAVEIERSEVERVIQELAKLLGSLRRKGKLRGVKEGSMLHKIGLRDGDLVKTVNGFDFTDPDQAVEAYAKLRRAGQLDIAYERDGKLWTVPVKIKP